MMTPAESIAPAYFEEKYAADADPWEFETSPYERAKYDATLAALPRPRYASAYEIGCSIGVLTERLAARCGRLLASDVSETALDMARKRCADLPHVAFENRRLPTSFPDGPFDLVVFSEVGYYFSEPDLIRARDGLVGRLVPGGHFLLVHWTPVVPHYPLTGDRVHEVVLANEGLRVLKSARAPKYRLDLAERA